MLISTWQWVKIQIVPPVNIPIPTVTRIGSNMAGAPTKMESHNGFDHHSRSFARKNVYGHLTRQAPSHWAIGRRSGGGSGRSSSDSGWMRRLRRFSVDRCYSGHFQHVFVFLVADCARPKDEFSAGNEGMTPRTTIPNGFLKGIPLSLPKQFIPNTRTRPARDSPSLRGR